MTDIKYGNFKYSIEYQTLTKTDKNIESTISLTHSDIITLNILLSAVMSEYNSQKETYGRKE